MPPLPDVPKVVRVALGVVLGSGNSVITRFFISYTGTAPANADLATFNAAVATAFGSHGAALLNSSSVLEQVESVDLTSATGAVATTAVSVTGTRTGTSLPAEASLVASYEIARRYRGGHPRGYWPYGTITDLSSNRVWAGAFTTAAKTAIDAFFTSVIAAGWSGAGTLQHVNVSYYHGFTVITNPITGRARNVPTTRGTPLIDPVTSVIARPSIGTQRRRIHFVD